MARHFLVERISERQSPRSIELNLCRKINQRELYVWLLKQTGNFKKDMIEYIIDAFGEEEAE